MPSSFFINRRPPQASGAATFPIAVSDTGATNTDTVALKTSRGLADTGVSMSDTVALRDNRPLSDTGTTNTDTVQLRTSRAVSDTGVSNSDTLVRRVARPLADTGVTNTDTLQLKASRILADTGVANSDTLQLRTSRVLADTGVSMSDTLTRIAKRILADTGATNADAIQLRTTRVISDTGVTNTDSVAIVKGPVRAVSDTGVTNTDTLQLRTIRVLSDTGATITDTLRLVTSRVLSDTGVTQTDSVTALRSFPRGVSDTGLTQTDTVSTRRTRVLTDTGATITDSLTRRVTRVVSDTGVTVTDSLILTRRRVLADTGTTITDSVVITVTHPSTPAITTPLTGLVYGTPASGTITPEGDTGLVIVSLRGVATQQGDTGYPSWAFPTTRVATLGYSNQVLGGVVVGDVETLIGRQFHGLRQNQAYTTTGVGTAVTEFDAGRTTSYRSIQFDTAPGGWAGVATGVADTQLTAFCNAVIAANRWTSVNPFLVCLHHEATLSPFGTAGFLAADYKAMWAHCVPMMLATGAPIAFALIGWDRMFVGANGVGPPTPGQGINDLDPGASLYTYLGSDPYNAIDAPGVLRYGTNAVTLLEPIRQAAIARGKDWMMGEMGCEDGATTQDHVNKALWLDSLRLYLDGLGSIGPGVCRVMLTTLKASAENYNVDSSAESIAAWQRLGHDAYYA